MSDTTKHTIVKEMTPAASKRSIWRTSGNTQRAYRMRRYAGSLQMVPAVNDAGIQWSRAALDENGQRGEISALR